VVPVRRNRALPCSTLRDLSHMMRLRPTPI
jgi:hypothetical protein